MDLNRRVYRLSPSQLSAETIAVTFAKTSRSPEPFDVIAAELDEEKSSKFSEKWIVGYGHSSVAEHAVLHLAIENVSRLAIETIEANRLASYTEKSTRYQEWDPKAFVIPAEIIGTTYQSHYAEFMHKTFTAYRLALEALRPWGELHTPRTDKESEKAWANRARVKAVDVARFLLPAASMANVGVTMNARTLEYAIKKMLTSELAEVREIGEEVKRVATQELPTLVKYANPIAYLPQLREICREYASQIDSLKESDWCQLLDTDPGGEDDILASVLFRFGDDSYGACLDQIRNMNQDDKIKLADALFDGMSDFDVPLRELEYANQSFSLVMDQGAYFEFKRHRMMAQTTQDLSTRLGYSMPRAFVEAGLEKAYREVMTEAGQIYEELASFNPQIAAYVVPNAFNRRVLCRTNLRELFHFIKLRSAENAHFSIRRVSRGMLEQIESIYPILSSKIAVTSEENSQSISEEYFSHLVEQLH